MLNEQINERLDADGSRDGKTQEGGRETERKGMGGLAGGDDWISSQKFEFKT